MARTRLFASIRPELLRWARETAGFPVQTAAKKLKLSADRLAAAEDGKELLTIPKLRQAAKLYRRPFAAFFLPAAPPVPAPIHDFRTLPGEPVGEPSPALEFELRRSRRKRSVATELFAELDIPVPKFDLAATKEEDHDVVAKRARDWLGVSIEAQRAWRDERVALNAWIAALESRGVLVFQSARVPLSIMRGLSIPAPELPAIVLNGKDRPRGRVFTAMHELTHLMLKDGGICDPLRPHKGKTPDAAIETFCNRVAGSILVPREAFLKEPAVSTSGTDWNDANIRTLADTFSVSREVIVLRLRAVDLVAESFVTERLEQYRQEYMALAAAEKATAKEKNKKIIIPPARLAVRSNGRRYTALVLEALDRERITFADAAEYLGVRVRHFDRMSDDVRGSFDEAV